MTSGKNRRRPSEGPAGSPPDPSARAVGPARGGVWTKAEPEGSDSSPPPKGRAALRATIPSVELTRFARVFISRGAVISAASLILAAATAQKGHEIKMAAVMIIILPEKEHHREAWERERKTERNKKKKQKEIGAITFFRRLLRSCSQPRQPASPFALYCFAIIIIILIAEIETARRWR